MEHAGTRHWRPRAAAFLAIGTLVAASASQSSDRLRCEVDFEVGALPLETALGSAEFAVEYHRPKIFPLNPQGEVVCEGLVEGSAVTASNQFDSASQGTLDLTFSSASGAAPNSPVLRCEVYSAGTSEADPGDFPVIRTDEARDTAGVGLDPLPEFLVGAIVCDAPPTTSTSTTVSTSTSTTLPLPCGDADGDGTVEAGDALIALRAAVGLPTICTFSLRCDVDGNGKVATSDALRILQVAVGIDAPVNCLG